MTENTVMVTDTIERQRNYVDQQKQKGHGLGVVFADAFLRGMRDLGYKSSAWALAEQIDNSFQAGADNVAVRFHFDASNKGKSKPDQIAICDNGNGMIPEMIGFAVRWGGTDREGDRKGLGRYGYGLPSSAVSIAKRYTVYSKTANTDWHAVTVDIDDLAAAAGDTEKTEAMLVAKPAKLPKWLLDINDDGPDLASIKSGTVVVFEEMDRLRRTVGWITANTLKTKLLQHFGVIYRHYVPERKIVVDGTVAQAVDPLFLMEHGRFYKETSVLAQRMETRNMEVETSSGAVGKVSIRASVLPPNFQSADPKKFGRGTKNNSRADIMREYNGLQICRGMRQIDCVLPRFTKFQNEDANVKIEIDFDPVLDEFFGVTTAKQQIVIDDEMWEKLQHDGKGGGALIDLVKSMRSEFRRQQKELEASVGNTEASEEEEPRASAQAMEDSEKFKGSTSEPSTEQKEEAKRNLEEAAEKRSEVTGEKKEEVIEKLVEETKKRRWEVEFASIPEGPFYRPFHLGEQKRVIINTDHPFYTRVYTAAPEIRAALEVLLFVLAERELEVKKDAETFYKAERQRWSERLRHALDTLVPDDAMVDKANAVAEMLHVSEGVTDEAA